MSLFCPNKPTRESQIKIIFLFILTCALFFPPGIIYAAQGGCICNNPDPATGCPNEEFEGATMAIASATCTQYCTRPGDRCRNDGRGVSEFIPYWPCTCCDGTDSFTIGAETYSELSEEACRRECATRGGTAQAGDPTVIFVPDCPGVGGARPPGCYCDGTLREAACTADSDCAATYCPLARSVTCIPGYTPPAARDPGCYCDGTLTRAMTCSTSTDCASVCGTAAPMCVPGYSEPRPSSSDTSPGGPVDLPTGAPPPKISLENPLGDEPGATSVPVIIGNIFKTILTIVGALALGMFVYGGFTWLTSGGSSDRIQKGKNILMWATIGLIVIFASYTLVDFLLRAFGA